MKKLFLPLVALMVIVACQTTKVDENSISQSTDEFVTIQIAIAEANDSEASSTRLSIAEDDKTSNWITSWSDSESLGGWQDGGTSFDLFSLYSVSDDGKTATFYSSSVDKEGGSVRLVYPYSNDAAISNGVYTIDLSNQVLYADSYFYSYAHHYAYMVSDALVLDLESAAYPQTTPQMSFLATAIEVIFTPQGLPDDAVYRLGSVVVESNDIKSVVELDLSLTAENPSFTASSLAENTITVTAQYNGGVVALENGVEHKIPFSAMPFEVYSDMKITLNLIRTPFIGEEETIPFVNQKSADSGTGINFKVATHNYLTAEMEYNDMDEQNIMEISSLADLESFRDAVSSNVSLNARLTKDIDISSVSDWVPIASEDLPYSGIFDGCGNKIIGMTMTGASGSADYYGFFAAVEGGSVRNVVFDSADMDISANPSAFGVIAGYLKDGSIEGCAVDGGTLSGNGTYIGGLVGHMTGSIIIRCYNTAKISGSIDVGGIVGYTEGYVVSQIVACYNAGSLSGSNVGGLVGDTQKFLGSTLSVYDESCNFIGCYNAGNLNGSSRSGAFSASVTPYYTVSYCCYLSSTDMDYSTRLTRVSSVSELNSAVDDMNTAIKRYLYIEGEGNVVPSLLGESVEVYIES